MAQRQIVDCVYIRAPIYHFFRNGCVPALAHVVVQRLKCAGFVISLPKDSQGPSDHKDIYNMNFYDFLRIVHQKGKKLEQKRKKEERKTVPPGGGRDASSQEASSVCSSLLNNLKENEDILSKVFVSQLLTSTCNDEALKHIKELDLTFLLYLLTNDILQFPLDQKLFEAINQIKRIRNDVFHKGSSYKFHDVVKTLNLLSDATQEIYNYSGVNTNIDKMKQESLKEIDKRCDQFSTQIFEELKQEIDKSRRCSKHHVLPDIVRYGSDLQCTSRVDNLWKFINDYKTTQPIIICGAPGAGKTSVLINLADQFTQNVDTSDFSLTFYLDTCCRFTRNIMWSQVFEILTHHASKTESRYGRSLVEDTIQIHADKILFLLDWNLQCVEDKLVDVEWGTWVITLQGTHTMPSYCHLLKVLPLNENKVEKILQSISYVNESRHICEQYKKCKFKGLLDAPDMVSIFHEIGGNAQYETILERFIERKVGHLEDFHEELIKLGRAAFCLILNNRMLYNSDDLQNIRDEVKKPFFEYHDEYASFRYRVIEDFLSAKYVISQPEEACNKWLKQVPLFKRVFRITCAMWTKDEESIQNNLPLIKSYLMKLFSIEKPNQEHKKRNKKKANKHTCQNSNSNNNEESMDVDLPEGATSTAESSDNTEECGNKISFTMWSFIVKLAETCQYRQEIVELLVEMLASKNSWVLKCKCLDESNIDKIAEILKNVKITKRLTIKLESGSSARTLKKVWNMLSTLAELAKHAFIQIMIIQKDFLPAFHEERLKELSCAIANCRDTQLNITKYVGPFICSGIPQFFKCLCMQKLEVLDVCVYDIATLQEILSCTGLSCLREVWVRVVLKANEQDIKDDVRFCVLEPIPLNLTIKYFDRLQELLDKFDPPHNVTSLSIHDVYIHKAFKIDLSHFKDLICLFVRFIPGAKNAKDIARNQEPMETTEIEEKNERTMKMPFNEWALQVKLNLTLPERLQRLMLRNVEFYNNTNYFVLSDYFDKYPGMQRLIIEDSSLSITGVRKLLNEHVKQVQQTLLNNGDIEHSLKRCKIDRRVSSQLKEWHRKRPRLEKEERERKRKNKPDGWELIITSNFSSCESCKTFPCSCLQQDGEDHRDTLEDFINLIEDVYDYDILSFSYTSPLVTVRKDMCGDLRVHCPLTRLTDDAVNRLSLDNEETRDIMNWFFQTLTLAQSICLYDTDLTYEGAMAVVEHLKLGKMRYNYAKDVEPFHLTIMSTYHSKSEDETLNSTFLNFLKNEKCLAQLNFWCSCERWCHRIKKACTGNIFFNGEQIKPNTETE